MKIPKRTRAVRIGVEMKKIISEFLRKEVEAWFENCLITIPEVRVSDDLKHARIYASIHTESVPEEEIRRAIVRSLPKLKKHVAGMIRIRQLPEFRFFWDDTLERADRIEQLLNKIHNSQSPPNEDDSADS